MLLMICRVVRALRRSVLVGLAAEAPVWHSGSRTKLRRGLLNVHHLSFYRVAGETVNDRVHIVFFDVLNVNLKERCLEYVFGITTNA